MKLSSALNISKNKIEHVFNICKKVHRELTEINCSTFCSREDYSFYFCAECFFQSEHQHHRAVQCLNEEGYCHCGCKFSNLPSLTCQHHTGYTANKFELLIENEIRALSAESGLSDIVAKFDSYVLNFSNINNTQTLQDFISEITLFAKNCYFAINIIIHKLLTDELLCMIFQPKNLSSRHYNNFLSLLFPYPGVKFRYAKFLLEAYVQKIKLNPTQKSQLFVLNKTLLSLVLDFFIDPIVTYSLDSDNLLSEFFEECYADISGLINSETLKKNFWFQYRHVELLHYIFFTANSKFCSNFVTKCSSVVKFLTFHSFNGINSRLNEIVEFESDILCLPLIQNHLIYSVFGSYLFDAQSNDHKKQLNNIVFLQNLKSSIETKLTQRQFLKYVFCSDNIAIMFMTLALPLDNLFNYILLKNESGLESQNVTIVKNYLKLFHENNFYRLLFEYCLRNFVAVISHSLNFWKRNGTNFDKLICEYSIAKTGARANIASIFVLFIMMHHFNNENTLTILLEFCKRYMLEKFSDQKEITLLTELENFPVSSSTSFVNILDDIFTELKPENFYSEAGLQKLLSLVLHEGINSNLIWLQIFFNLIEIIVTYGLLEFEYYAAHQQKENEEFAERISVINKFSIPLAIVLTKNLNDVLSWNPLEKLIIDKLKPYCNQGSKDFTLNENLTDYLLYGSPVFNSNSQIDSFVLSNINFKTKNFSSLLNISNDNATFINFKVNAISKLFWDSENFETLIIRTIEALSCLAEASFVPDSKITCVESYEDIMLFVRQSSNSIYSSIIKIIDSTFIPWCRFSMHNNFDKKLLEQKLNRLIQGLNQATKIITDKVLLKYQKIILNELSCLFTSLVNINGKSSSDILITNNLNVTVAKDNRSSYFINAAKQKSSILLEKIKSLQLEAFDSLIKDESAKFVNLEDSDSYENESIFSQTQNHRDQLELILSSQFTCDICREKGTLKEPLHYICQITESNSLQRITIYDLLDVRTAKFTLKYRLTGGYSYPFIIPNLFYKVKTCKHAVHYKCFDPSSTNQNSFTSLFEGDNIKCPMCRSSADLIFPIIPFWALFADGGNGNVDSNTFLHELYNECIKRNLNMCKLAYNLEETAKGKKTLYAWKYDKDNEMKETEVSGQAQGNNTSLEQPIVPAQEIQPTSVSTLNTTATNQPNLQHYVTIIPIVTITPQIGNFNFGSVDSNFSVLSQDLSNIQNQVSEISSNFVSDSRNFFLNQSNNTTDQFGTESAENESTNHLIFSINALENAQNETTAPNVEVHMNPRNTRENAGDMLTNMFNSMFSQAYTNNTNVTNRQESEVMVSRPEETSSSNETEAGAATENQTNTFSELLSMLLSNFNRQLNVETNNFASFNLNLDLSNRNQIENQDTAEPANQLENIVRQLFSNLSQLLQLPKTVFMKAFSKDLSHAGIYYYNVNSPITYYSYIKKQFLKRIDNSIEFKVSISPLLYAAYSELIDVLRFDSHEATNFILSQSKIPLCVTLVRSLILTSKPYSLDFDYDFDSILLDKDSKNFFDSDINLLFLSRFSRLVASKGSLAQVKKLVLSCISQIFFNVVYHSLFQLIQYDSTRTPSSLYEKLLFDSLQLIKYEKPVIGIEQTYAVQAMHNILAWLIKSREDTCLGEMLPPKKSNQKRFADSVFSPVIRKAQNVFRKIKNSIKMSSIDKYDNSLSDSFITYPVSSTNSSCDDMSNIHVKIPDEPIVSIHENDIFSNFFSTVAEIVDRYRSNVFTNNIKWQLDESDLRKLNKKEMNLFKTSPNERHATFDHANMLLSAYNKFIIDLINENESRKYSFIFDLFPKIEELIDFSKIHSYFLYNTNTAYEFVVFLLRYILVNSSSTNIQAQHIKRKETINYLNSPYLFMNDCVKTAFMELLSNFLKFSSFCITTIWKNFLPANLLVDLFSNSGTNDLRYILHFYLDLNIDCVDNTFDLLFSHKTFLEHFKKRGLQIHKYYQDVESSTWKLNLLFLSSECFDFSSQNVQQNKIMSITDSNKSFHNNITPYIPESKILRTYRYTNLFPKYYFDIIRNVYNKRCNICCSIISFSFICFVCHSYCCSTCITMHSINCLGSTALLFAPFTNQIFIYANSKIFKYGPLYQQDVLLPKGSNLVKNEKLELTLLNSFAFGKPQKYIDP